MEKTSQKTLVFRTWKTKTIATVLAVVGAVALPQVFHLLGAVTNMGTTLGETFLPMHLAIFLVGLLAGPVAGAAAGLISPAISYALSGMPTVVMLPYMMIELMGYGLVAGLLAKVKMPSIVKLLIAQVGGRALRALALVIGIYAFGSPMNIAIIWNSIVAGLPGLILQWVIVPLLIFYIEKKAAKRD